MFDCHSTLPRPQDLRRPEDSQPCCQLTYPYLGLTLLFSVLRQMAPVFPLLFPPLPRVLSLFASHHYHRHQRARPALPGLGTGGYSISPLTTKENLLPVKRPPSLCLSKTPSSSLGHAPNPSPERGEGIENSLEEKAQTMGQIKELLQISAQGRQECQVFP